MKKKYIIISAALLSLSGTLPYVYAEEIIDIVPSSQEVLQEEVDEGIIIQDNEVILDSKYDDLSILTEDDLTMIHLDNMDIQDIIKISNSNIILKLTNSHFQGSILSDNSDVSIQLDKDSTLTLDSDLYLFSLDDELDDYSNIVFNDYHIYVDGEDILLFHVDDVDSEENDLDAYLLKEEVVEPVESDSVETKEEVNDKKIVSHKSSSTDIKKTHSSSTNSTSISNTRTKQQKQNSSGEVKQSNKSEKMGSKNKDKKEKSVYEEKDSSTDSKDELKNKSNMKSKDQEESKSVDSVDTNTGLFDKFIDTIVQFFHTLFQKKQN